MIESTTQLTGEPSGLAQLSDDERLRLLSDERRRTVLEIIAERTAPIDLDELVAAIERREGNGGVPPAEADETIAISLHHNHLPRLTDFGVIDYDPETNRIAPAR